jgi:hypothetical protein
MNRLYIAIGTIVLIISISVISLFSLKNTTKEIAFRLDEIKTYSKEEKIEDAIKSADKLYNFFSKKSDMLILFIRHDSIEELEETLSRLSPLLENQDSSEFYAEVSKAIGLTEKLINHELPLIKNIL